MQRPDDGDDVLLTSGPADAWEPRGDASSAAYQQAFLAHTSASWELVEQAQGDLLALLVDRVPAVVGAEVILGLAVLFRERSDGDAAGQTLLATAMDDLRPGYAWTLLVAIADAFANAEAGRFDERPVAIRAGLERALRRLLALDLPVADRAALERIRELGDATG